MLSDAERRVLAEIEGALRRDDGRYVALFDQRRTRRPRRRLAAATCLAVLLVLVAFAAAALAWL